MTSYPRLYRWGITPWERYRDSAVAGLTALLDQEEADRTGRLGRALDLGCGRGLFTRVLAKRGWEATGVDYVPAAIEAAQQHDNASVQYVVGDVTDLPGLVLGRFDLFLDIGCFQGLDAEQRRDEGRGVSRLANPGATVLMLAFGRTRWRSLIGGVSRREVEAAFTDWELVAVHPASTSGLGWPMNTTTPLWYRLRWP